MDGMEHNLKNNVRVERDEDEASHVRIAYDVPMDRLARRAAEAGSDIHRTREIMWRELGLEPGDELPNSCFDEVQPWDWRYEFVSEKDAQAWIEKLLANEG